MSWNLHTAGKPAAVKAVVLANKNISPTLQAAIVEICDDKQWPSLPHDGIAIHGYGHSGESSSIGMLNIERITLAKEAVANPEPIAPSAPTPEAAPAATSDQGAAAPGA